MTVSVLSSSVPPDGIASRGIEAQVQQGLLQFSGIGIHGTDVLPQNDVHGNAIADQRLKHLCQIGDQLVGINIVGLENAAATEPQELASKRRGPVAPPCEPAGDPCSAVLAGRGLHLRRSAYPRSLGEDC